MGKKRKEEDREVNEIPPDVAPASENKKTKVAAFHKLSLETLREKEKEAARELKSLHNELTRQRAARVTSYGDNNLRNMNTKRHRAEFVLGEIRAEIERRKIKKTGSAIPDEGILAGSAAGQAATKWDHYYEGKALTAKQREEKALAEKQDAMDREWEEQSANQMMPRVASVSQPMAPDPWANAWAATAKATSNSMNSQMFPNSFDQVEAAYMMSGGVPSTASCGGMMGMMGGMPEFAMHAQQNAAMSAPHMMHQMHAQQIGMMNQMPQQMPVAFQAMQSMPSGIPAAFANVKADETSLPSNIPAAFRKRVA